jgi:hypothetical protein
MACTEPNPNAVKIQYGVRRPRTITTAALVLVISILIAILTAACEQSSPAYLTRMESKSPDGSVEVLLSRMPIFDTQVTRYAGLDITVTQAIFEKQTPPTVDQLEKAFKSSDVTNARRLLGQAWHELGSTTSTEVTQDHFVQALMAECLIQGNRQIQLRIPTSTAQFSS